MEESVAAVVEVATVGEESMAATVVAELAIVGNCDGCLLQWTYYFIVVDILFYYDVYIILLY